MLANPDGMELVANWYMRNPEPTKRSLAALPVFHAGNLADFFAGKITDEALETNKSIYDRYVAALPAVQRARAEGDRPRQQTEDGKPTRSGIRSSGDIEYDAGAP